MRICLAQAFCQNNHAWRLAAENSNAGWRLFLSVDLSAGYWPKPIHLGVKNAGG
jgi:hypothetical protein